METLICNACGAENLRSPKQQPTNQREAKQVRFLCGACGRKNLRDGSVPGFEITKEQEQQDKGKEDDLGDFLFAGGLVAFVFTVLRTFIKGK